MTIDNRDNDDNLYIFSKKVGKSFVNRNQIYVPLQCQIERVRAAALRLKIARINSGNCAH